jgi:hypothetical protein
MKKNYFFISVFVMTLISLNVLFPHNTFNKINIQQYEYNKYLNKAEGQIKTKKTITLKTKIKPLSTPPLKNVGGSSYNIKDVKQWDDVLLLAALINSECRSCILTEREVIAQVVRNRVRDNFDNKGNTYYKQISARSQFSGFKEGSHTGHLFYYKGAYRIKIKNNVYYTDDIYSFIQNYNSKESKKISFEELKINRDRVSIENYKIAYDVIVNNLKTIPDDVYYFCNSSIATNLKEVQRQRRDCIALHEFFHKDTIAQFGHDIFAYGKP